jgi:hypothetical protein
VPVDLVVETERKAGQFLGDMKEQDLLSRGAATSRTDIISARLTLAELGIEQKESSLWQRIAAILLITNRVENKLKNRLKGPGDTPSCLII